MTQCFCSRPFVNMMTANISCEKCAYKARNDSLVSVHWCEKEVHLNVLKVHLKCTSNLKSIIVLAKKKQKTVLAHNKLNKKSI